MKIGKFIKVWPESWLVFVAILLMYFLEEIVLFIDPTGAVIHQDYWQHVLIAVLTSALLNGAAYLGIYLNHPNLFRWYIQKMDSEQGSPWLFFAYYSVKILTLVLVLMAVV